MSDTDMELLAGYTRQHSSRRNPMEADAEDDFAELVRRHLGLVFSAALRQVRSPQLAEEVAQSAFIKLARRAHGLAPDTILTAWLYQVTRREAIDVVRREASRQLREQIVTEMSAMNATAADGSRQNPMEADWSHIEPLLDEAMHALDDTDRTAVLLRYFENKSLREVGATLGTSENAAQKRLARAVEQLREFFTKHGVNVGASGLVVVISANAVPAAPVGLSATIAVTAAVAGTNAAPTLMAMTLPKAFATAAIVAAVGFGIYKARQASSLQNQVSTLQRQQAGFIEEFNRDRDERTRQFSALREENGRLQRDTTELVQLRGEVTRLRREMAAVRKGPGPIDPRVAAKEADPKPEPVRFFVANAQTTVPAGQTLAFGGWGTTPGKRTLVFVKPGIVELSGAGRVGTIILEGRLIEVSEEMLAASEVDFPGLSKLKAEGEESFTHSLFSAEEAALILKTLESNARTLVIGAPRIQTGDGTSATLSSTEQKTMNGQEYSLGPSLEVTPSIDADGSSVKLNVTARLNVINPDLVTAKTAP